MNTDAKPPFRQALEAFIRREAQPPDKFSHQPRLYHIATEVGAGLVYDDEVLHAAAWLHDLGVFVGHRPADLEALAAWDNVAYAAREAPVLLRRFGFPEAKIPFVVITIEDHQPGRDPRALEATILRDADILEQLGAMGVLRLVSKVGRDTRFPTFAEAVEVLERNLNTLPARLRLPCARELARPRVEILRRFLEAVRTETGSVPLGDR
jgi:uncharacterized protein